MDKGTFHYRYQKCLDIFYQNVLARWTSEANYKQLRSVISATGYSIISFLGVAGCGFLSLGINMLKHIESFSRWKKLGSRKNLIVIVEKRWNILINKHIIQ